MCVHTYVMGTRFWPVLSFSLSSCGTWGIRGRQNVCKSSVIHISLEGHTLFGDYTVSFSNCACVYMFDFESILVFVW